MATEAGWKPDPGGTHEWRWWDGSAWSDHVSDGGEQSSDPLPDPSAVAPPADEGAPPPPTVEAKKGGGWKDRIKAAAEQGKQLADTAKAKVAEQQAARLEQLKNDPETLWFGTSQNPATKATGISKATYRITKDKIWIDTGVLGVRSEQVPLWAIKDIDVRQSVLQRGKDVGDVALHLEDPNLAVNQGNAFGLSGQVDPHMSGSHTSGEVLLDNIEGPYQVRDLLMPLVSEARQKKLMERQSQFIHHVTPAPGMAAPGPAAAPGPPVDVADQLRKLAELRDQGVLTEEEFAAQKAKLLG